ncbi:four and a half LIM domains protein 2-like isoform X2 [Rhopilema esculentum]|uniref:four and a half LIM domains protein 2-like isoform X2 n=1 Tax=Rhopilema esculentum TaxID=499914 RepID=UPI0031D9BFEF
MLTTNERIVMNGELKRTPPRKPPRRVCNNCKCTKEDHEIGQGMDEKMNQLNITDRNENEDLMNEKILSQYAWVPPGLDAALVESYMSSLPDNQVPKYENTEAMKYRNKQLLLQFPVQDSSFDRCNHIPQAAKHVFDQFTKAKEADIGTGHVEKAFRVKECQKCHQNIEIGSAYVLAFSLGEEASWHPACFQCSKCNELLMNLIFFHSDDDIFCGRHYAEISKPRCDACDEVILFGEYVKASENAYHVQHFCCWICDKELSGKQHLIEAQQPICIDCYNNKFANTCYKCNKRISMDDKDILYENHHWHDTCLKCVVCNETLSGRSFLTRENEEFICTDCHRKTDERRCKTCGEGFEPGMKRLELNGIYWHDTCFICELCKEPISSKRFMRHQDLTVCVRCYEDTFVKKCVTCNLPLTQGGISYNGEAYHKECFVCVKCNASIASQSFSVKDDDRFCVQCYSNLFAKKCKACSDYILSGEYYTLDDDTWHKDCFRCTKCGEALANSSFVQEGDEVLLVCEKCIESD